MGLMMTDRGVTHARSPSPIIKQEEGKKKKKDSLPPNVTSVVALIINTV